MLENSSSCTLEIVTLKNEMEFSALSHGLLVNWWNGIEKLMVKYNIKLADEDIRKMKMTNGRKILS